MPNAYVVGLQVTDASLVTDTDTVTVTFANVTPTAAAGVDQSAVRQQTVNVSGTGNNTSSDAIVLYEWDLDDNGSFEFAGQNASTVFTSTGTFEINFRVTDDDGDISATDTLQITVNAAGLVGGNLLVGGSNGGDVIAIRTTNVAGQYKVLFSGVEVGRYTPSGHVIVNAGDGHDSVDIGNNVGATEVYGGIGNDTLDGGNGNDSLNGEADNDVINGHAGNDVSDGGTGNDSVNNDAGDDELVGGDGNDTLRCGGGADEAHGGLNNDSIIGGIGNDSLYGDAGNDTVDGGGGNDLIDGGADSDDLNGGGGSDIVVGAAGNDNVQGGAERDLLIGGAGADNVVGNADEDILIAGTTSHDNNESNLNAIMTTWNGGSGYSTRVAALQVSLLVADVTVFDDGAVDTLVGGAGTDWFLFNNDAGPTKDIVDIKPAETGTDVD